MMRSMSSAVTSLKNHQTKMDVIGNNIANVSTTAYKAARVTFKDTFNQMVRGASGTSVDRGGINPSQVGLGMTTNSIDNAMDPGNIDSTGIGTDVFISGAGFFEVKSADGVFYTRDGNFTPDEEGYLVTRDGRFVQGYQADANGNIIETKDRIRIPLSDIKEPRATKNVTLVGNLDSRAGTGIAKMPTDIKQIYNIIPDDPTKVPATFGDKGKYSLKGEYSDNEQEKRTSIIGATATFKVYDTLGGAHTIRIDFIKQGTPQDRKYALQVFYVSPDGESMVPADSTTISGIPTNGIQFKADGKLTDDSKKALENFSVKLMTNANINGSEDVNAKIDLTAVTMFETKGEVKTQTNDGYPLGKMTKFSIGSDGIVTAIYNNGDRKALGQIALATFANDNGLMKEGDNLWSPTQNSGDPNIVKPGSGSAGVLQSGALEMSNVDLAKEFTQMIITQRGFQANARTISTTDQMLEELVNLKR